MNNDTKKKKVFEKLQVVELTADFRRAVQVVPVDERLVMSDAPCRKGHVTVQNLYAGINASDVNFTAGKYVPGMKVPCDCGFESVGIVTKVGPGVTAGVKVGDAVITLQFGAFADICEVPVSAIVVVPKPDPRYMALYLSALTAYVSIMEMAQPIAPNSVALVTAAAGGTGQFAVQILSKLFGCKVIGTCSSDEKVAFIQSLGCHRAVNYKKESLASVIKEEFPKGVDIVYECVGGEMFAIAVSQLAPKGRIVVIGGVSQYADGSAWGQKRQTDTTDNSDGEKKEQQRGGNPARTAARPIPLQMALLTKSGTVSGFFLPHYASTIPKHFASLLQLHKQGKIVVGIDPTPFVGIRSIPDAVDHLYKGGNVGKVVVKLENFHDGSRSAKL